MKKNILVLAVLALTLTLVSCGNVSGGNKGIVPVDSAVPAAPAHSQEQHAEH